VAALTLRFKLLRGNSRIFGKPEVILGSDSFAAQMVKALNPVFPGFDNNYR
jgi:hypothetical protein